MKESSAPQALIVDDDPLQRETLTLALRKLGIAVVATSTAREFIRQVKAVKPDLLFVDLNLESMGVGFSVIKAIRGSLGREPKVFVISGDSDRSSIAHSMEIGANDYFVKPITYSTLAAKLSRYVTTASLASFAPKFMEIIGGGADAKIQVAMAVRELDEFGVWLQGPHLLLKGAAIRLEGPFIAELTGKSHVLVTVTANLVDPELRQYSARADFDSTDDHMMQKVRLWIQGRSTQGVGAPSR